MAKRMPGRLPGVRRLGGSLLPLLTLGALYWLLCRRRRFCADLSQNLRQGRFLLRAALRCILRDGALQVGDLLPKLTYLRLEPLRVGVSALSEWTDIARDRMGGQLAPERGDLFLQLLGAQLVVLPEVAHISRETLDVFPDPLQLCPLSFWRGSSLGRCHGFGLRGTYRGVLGRLNIFFCGTLCGRIGFGFACIRQSDRYGNGSL
jgi:hypothetical protein